MTYPTVYPPAKQRLVKASSDGFKTPPLGLIPHVQVGNNSLFERFNNVANEVSSHLWLSKIGNFEQYVLLNRKAWAQMSGNPYWISVECEGYDTEDYTPIQVQRLAELYLWGVQNFHWPLQVTDHTNIGGLGTHRMGGDAWGAHSCPGDIRANRRMDIIRLVSGQTDNRFSTQPVLRIGARGPAVVVLQNSLNICFGHEADHPSDPNRLQPDGDFGAKTFSQVLMIQRIASKWSPAITSDGVVGPVTWSKLARILTGMGR